MRGATKKLTNIKRHCVFQSTLLMRGATEEKDRLLKSVIFQSTLLMRGATIQFSVQSHHPLISIHAPHARSDKEAENDFNQFKHFNPRSSCEERPKKAVHYGTYVNFNPRSSCEERLICPLPFNFDYYISIHAPHARSDILIDSRVFLS